jgi:hypothetical protein
MSQKCSKKLVLLKTYYYKIKTQDGKNIGNRTEFVTNPPTASSSIIFRMTDKNFIPIKNDFFEYTKIVIPANNPISGISKQITQDNVMLKTKCGFVSFNTFYFDDTSSYFATVPIIDYSVTASSGDLKNAVKVTIEFDNNGSTSWSNGVKFARRVKVYGSLE